MDNEGVLKDYLEDVPKNASIKRLISMMSEDNRDAIEMSIFIGELLDKIYNDYPTEVEMLVLSMSNYTHKEISDVLNISRLGVTKRIAKAREVLRWNIEDMLGGEKI